MIAYVDCSSGVSGDKLLGALVDAGFDPGRLREALAALGLEQVVVETPARVSRGVSGTGVTVTETGAPRRHWAELRGLLEASAIDEPARSGALRALGLLAEAEARVHGVPADHVHFHEIGAADTIADILGVALALTALEITELVASPVALGDGTVTTEHGELPVPAPATALLLEGLSVTPGRPGDGELTTPTGAVLLRAFATGTGAMPPMTLRRVGTGCGTRDLGRPNVCRVLLGEPLVSATGHDGVVLLETNLDHLTPEELATAAERIRTAGALDAWQTSVVMKKGRAAVVLSALATEDAAPALAERVMAETGTLGVRMMPADRRLAERDVTEIDTSLGPVRFKVARLPDGTRRLRAEADDVARIADENGSAVDSVAREVEAEAARVTGVQPMRQPLPSETTNPSA
ncbi:MAG: nickel pincer cofactor biosynthesis protein LarC [Coriobacteriia bacterium]|nr:nickel pincer cofactor biosynthesis protein LarC [Coriobacteriia bacterium]MBN2848742.1 nickel pincer cofactor biosynthesis protein LarC [Coriobacteriia bacterium]